MGIREEISFNRDGALFDSDYTAESIRELEDQYAAGQIEPHAYLIKKQALVRLYLRSTTAPRRQSRPFESEEDSLEG